MKKAVNLAAISALAISGYVAANPHQASAATTTNSLVVKAEQNKVLLIRAISMDYKANGKTQPWTEYNKAKKDYETAKKAVGKLSKKDRDRLNARLDMVKMWIDRTAVYIDAITSGKKLAGLQVQLEKNMAAGDLAKMTTSYNQLSYEIKKQAAYLYKVYGKSTRDGLLKMYEAPAQTAKQKALYPVSIYLEIGSLVKAVDAGNEALQLKSMQRISDWMEEIDSVSMRTTLYNYFMDQISPYLEEDISSFKPYDNFQFQTGDTEINAFDAFGFYNEDDEEIDADAFDQGYSIKDEKGYFNEDGTLAEAYETTGITEAGTDKITIIDTLDGDKVMAEVDVPIVAPAAATNN